VVRGHRQRNENDWDAVTERIQKSFFIIATLLTVSGLIYAAYSRPWYFTSQTHMSGLIFLEFLLAAVWLYRRVFFPVLLVTFLFAGINLPVGHGWTSARWVVLGVGASVGLLLVFKDRRQDFGFFHLVAFFTVLTGLISAAVSQYPNIALLKVLSLFLLFIYASGGVRVAAIGRESNFFNGLLTGCEMFVAANAAFYAAGIEAMGNPNSLGAVMGVFAAPILLWGILLGGRASVVRRRVALYVVCVGLAFISHARAGIAAGVLSSAVLCIASRRYKMLFQGVTVLVIIVAAVALLKPRAISSFTSSVVYKNSAEDILASRISPWQTAMDNIRDHPWFGMGLGTTATGSDADEEQGTFASTGTVTAEHGSSYLAILGGVGIVGAIPAAILLVLVITKIVRVLWAMRGSDSVSHPAIVLAIVMIAGIVHATFEDWMFAPGNYLCVFFWSLAFLFNDLASSFPRVSVHWRIRTLEGVTAARP
jgi:O-antigen ligase